MPAGSAARSWRCRRSSCCWWSWPGSGAAPTLAMAVFGLLIAPAAFRLVRSSVISGAARSSTSTRPGSPGSATAGSCAGTSSPSSSRRRHPGRPSWPASASASRRASHFLGLGSADRASWGLMLSDAFAEHLHRTAPAAVAEPGHRADDHGVQPAGQRPAGRARRAASAAHPGARKAGRPSGARCPSRRDAGAPRSEPDALLVVEGLHVSYPRAEAANPSW